jgi:hypothetical protein
MEDSSKNGMVKSTEFQLEDTSVFLLTLQRISTRFWTISIFRRAKYGMKGALCGVESVMSSKAEMATNLYNCTQNYQRD